MPRRILEGTVVSDKMDKTVTVLVERRYIHPIYKKYLRRTDKFAAHDAQNACRAGDRVQIEECAPISKRKCWTVISTAPEGREVAPQPEAKAAAPAKKAPAKKAPAKKAAPKKAPAKKAPAKKAPAKKAAAKSE